MFRTKNPGRTLTIAAALLTTHAVHVHADGGGGSSVLYTLDPTSPSLIIQGFPAGSIFVDDPDEDGVITLAVPASALRLPAAAWIRGLSGAGDNGIPAMYEFGNAMNWSHLRYQFGVDRGATDDFTAGVFGLPLSYEFPLFFPSIMRRSEFPLQFLDGGPGDDAAADVFDNIETPLVPFQSRFNFRMVEEGGPPGPSLELIGFPPVAPFMLSDNMNDFTTTAGIGGGPDVDFNSQLDVGSIIYFVVNDAIAGFNGATIYRMVGTNTPVGVPTVFAGPAALGLLPTDQIDAISVWDVGALGAFDGPPGPPGGLAAPGDGVVFSLAPDSPSLTTPGSPFSILPGDPNGVVHDDGSIFLVRPGPRLVAALQREYFSLSSGNLDGILCIDPREDLPPCLGPMTHPSVPADGLTLSQYHMELAPGAVGNVWVAINDPFGLPDGGAVSSFAVTAEVAEGGGAGVIGAESFICGPGGPFCTCCGGCGGAGPPCGAVASFFGCALGVPSTCDTPVIMGAWDFCLGDFAIEAFMPGTVRLTIRATVTTISGASVTIPPVDLIVNVITDCNANGIDDWSDLRAGLGADCNQNGALDACDISSGASEDCVVQLSVDATDRASLSSAGAEANGSSLLPLSVSANGRYVVFTSAAGNLVAGDGNGVNDVFLRDRESSTTSLVSIATTGSSGNGASETCDALAPGQSIAVTPAGDVLVVFQSMASNLIAGDTNGARDVIVRNMTTGTTTRIAPAGVQPNGAAGSPAISADGAYVAYHSAASNLVAPDLNVNAEVYRTQISNGATLRASISSAGVQPNTGTSERAAISANGQFVAFESQATSLVAGDTNAVRDVFLRDFAATTTVRVSVDSGGLQVPGSSDNVSMSADGRYVTFRSAAAVFVPGDTNGTGDVFMKDMLTASVLRVSTAGDGAQAVGDSFLGSISPDARYVAFSSGAANLVAGDTNAAFDVFVKNVQTGTIDIVSRSTAGVLGNADSAYAAMSADNGVVAIHSNAGNLVSGDSNGLGDTFTRVFRDCNANDQIDALEGDPGSISCGNGIPDECEPDCNGNAAPDACDIAAGTSQDADGNSIPDECAAAGNGDLNLDGLTNGADIMAFTACYISGSAAGPCAPADMDGDGDVDESDAALFTAALLGA